MAWRGQLGPLPWLSSAIHLGSILCMEHSIVVLGAMLLLGIAVKASPGRPCPIKDNRVVVSKSQTTMKCRRRWWHSQGGFSWLHACYYDGLHQLKAYVVLLSPSRLKSPKLKRRLQCSVSFIGYRGFRTTFNVFIVMMVILTEVGVVDWETMGDDDAPYGLLWHIYLLDVKCWVCNVVT
jgi:hypothetical protein